MSDTAKHPEPDNDETTIQTGYGPLNVPKSLLKIWNQYGWPEESVLRRMVEQQDVAAGPDTSG